MKTIWKYDLPISELSCIVMPKGAEILSVQTQYSKPVIWAMVESNNATEERCFEVYGTGHQMVGLTSKVDRRYINSFQLNGGDLVFHLFELQRV